MRRNRFISILLIFEALASIETQIVDSGVSCEERRIIVNVHNQLRQQVASGKLKSQPKASDMQLIVWDSNLEKIAQAWANNMVVGHSKENKDPRFATGENLMVIGPYLDYEIPRKWEEIITAWFNEHKLYKYQPFVKDEAVGHYTQVVWANTTYIGCGFATFDWNGRGPIAYYVCNYGPSGNYLGRLPYEIGSGCDYLCCEKQCSNLYGDNCEYIPY